MALNLRDFLASLGDDLIRVDDEIDPITQAGALCSAAPRPIMLSRLKGFPGWSLCDILVKDRARQAKALGTTPRHVVREDHVHPAQRGRLACRVAVHVTQEGQLLHGGWGYAEEYAISRYVVDAQVLPIFEGVKPILELKVIARGLLGG